MRQDGFQGDVDEKKKDLQLIIHSFNLTLCAYFSLTFPSYTLISLSLYKYNYAAPDLRGGERAKSGEF